MAKLTLRAVHVEEGLSDLQRQQVAWAIELYGQDEVTELTAFYSVHDESGTHVFDLHLFCDDDGMVHKAGTLDRVASFSQGGATGTEDQALMVALDDAVEALRTGAAS